MRFWQTKSFAIITYATVPGDCIDRVTSQNGDRVIFERLATPRAAPKVTLKSNWRTQHQQQQQQPQQPILEDDVPSIWKQRDYLGKPSRSARRYETRHGSGTSNRETGASHFSNGMHRYPSHCKGRPHECVLNQLVRTLKRWLRRSWRRRRWCPAKNPANCHFRHRQCGTSVS